MADVKENDRVLVNGSREVAGTVLPLWCNGKVGKVLRVEVSAIVVKLDGVSARELRFLQTEVEQIDSAIQ